MEGVFIEGAKEGFRADMRGNWRDHLKSRFGYRWAILDFLTGILACMLGHYLTPYYDSFLELHDFLSYGLPFGVLLVFMSQQCDVPIPGRSAGMGRYDLFASAFVSVFMSLLIFLGVIYAISADLWGRYVVLYMALICMLGLTLPRLLVSSFITEQPIKLAVYGVGTLARELRLRLANAKNFEIVGFMECKPQSQGQLFCGIPILGSPVSVGVERLKALGVKTVILCSEGQEQISDEGVHLLYTLPLNGIEVLNKAAFLEHYYQEVSVLYANLNCLASHHSLPGNGPFFASKRLFDFVGSGFGLLLALPLWPLLALAIKLDSKGPVLFRQTRVGYRGKHFEILKFRTMVQDAEKDGAQWAVKGDSRVTRLGKFLRISRLDELPQLWNVFRGDMSLVGPRPERPEFVSELAKEIPFYERRHMVPPGLTGWAQIKYKYGASKEDALRKLQFELYYIRHLSPGLDLQILLKTIPMMMKGSR